MCNAWNHSVGCNCGWGGDGHLGRRIDSNFTTVQRLFDRRRHQSYTIPNARCPVCGASVFFYKSENGGSVFFDELGPPWPKHPCADNSQYQFYTPTFLTNLTQDQRDWEKDGWVPVVVENNSKKSSFAYIVERIDKSSDNRIEIMIYGSEGGELTKKDTLVFFKKTDSQTFMLTAFDLNNNAEVHYNFKCEAAKLEKFCNNALFQSFRWTFGNGF